METRERARESSWREGELSGDHDVGLLGHAGLIRVEGKRETMLRFLEGQSWRRGRERELLEGRAGLRGGQQVAYVPPWSDWKISGKKHPTALELGLKMCPKPSREGIMTGGCSPSRIKERSDVCARLYSSTSMIPGAIVRLPAFTPQMTF